MKIEDEIKQKKFKNEQHKMIINLMFTGNWINAFYNKLYKPFDISLQQYNILRILRGQQGIPVSLNVLLERMLDKNSNTSRLVEKLKTKKLIERKESKEDRRQIEIVITKSGLDLLDKIDVVLQEHEKDLQKISTQEAEELNRILDKLRN